MIHNVWILEKSGRLLFSDKLGSIETEEDLLSGFLSAVYSFAEMEISSGIESMEMGEYNMIYCLSHGLLFVMAADKTDSSSSLKAQIDLIRDSFLDEFPDIKENHEEFLGNWLGNREAFHRFMFPLRDLIGSWVKVEATTSIAEKMDLLEVFQQIFSRIAKISLPVFREMTIRANLELKLMETIKVHKSVLEIEELSSIYDSEKTFLDVLSINISNPEITVSTLKITLLDLCKTILDILKEYLGKKDFGEEFLTNVFPYVKQDWDRIRDLELDKFFIDYII